MQAGSRRVVAAALLANLGLAIAKFVAFVFSGSATLLAEAVHSAADTSNQGLLLWGGYRAGREPTPEHPFGYARERYFWAFVVAVVLFALGSVYALVHGIEQFQHPRPLEQAGWGLGILALGIALESYAFHTALTEARRLKGEESWFAFVRRSKNPEIPVVLLEDFGALAGLVTGLVCLGLTVATGDPRWDGVGSIAIGVLLGVISLVMGIEMKSLLIGESARPHQVSAIRAAIEAHPRVRCLIHLRTQHLGPDELLVGAKVEFADGASLETVAEAIDSIEAELRARTPARVVYIEPDLHRSVPAAR